MNILDLKTNYMPVGRGASGIYLILKSHFTNCNVLVPANICYAAVFPIIYSGNVPVFCDVEPTTGNLCVNNIANYIDHVSAIIVPHMYGNPVADINKIRNLCDQKKVLMIEDCASSMGAQINNRYVGTFGDYVIYSTGYSKTIDLGNGGIIASDNPLVEEEKNNKRLPLYNSGLKIVEDDFSKKYRGYRNSGKAIQDTVFGRLIKTDLSELFLYQNAESYNKSVISKLTEIDEVIEIRRNNSDLYDRYLHYNDQIRPYVFAPGAVPWRKNLYVSADIKKNVIAYLLERSVPVSDWYPVVTDIFAVRNTFPFARQHEAEILNFPLLLPEIEIIRIADCINQAVRIV